MFKRLNNSETICMSSPLCLEVDIRSDDTGFADHVVFLLKKYSFYC